MKHTVIAPRYKEIALLSMSHNLVKSARLLAHVKANFRSIVIRDANSLAIFIPWGFGESGNGNLT